jgi:Family of unknown function (DUF695)
MKQYEVMLPEERLTIVDFVQEKMPGVAAINRELRKWEPKAVFQWHLSVMLHCRDLAANGMPSKDEQRVLDDFGNHVHQLFIADSEKPNALFLARITWNATRELIYRVYDPEPIHNELTSIIEKESAARPFDYRIDDDPEWKLANWHLNTALAGQSPLKRRP